jgi:hypothetical protein
MIPLFLPKPKKVRDLKLIDFLAQSYYSTVVMIIATVAALVVSIWYYGRHKDLRIFTYYIALSLTEDVIGLCGYMAPDWRSVYYVTSIAVNIFALFEFIICNLFILHYILSPKRRLVIKINLFVYPALLAFLLIKKYPDSIYTPYFLLGCIFLVIPCLFYFYELFQKVSLQPLKNQPAFWIVTAFLFHNACTIPFALTGGFLGKYLEAASSVVYFLYSIVFLFIIRANLCSPENSGDSPTIRKNTGSTGQRIFL